MSRHPLFIVSIYVPIDRRYCSMRSANVVVAIDGFNAQLGYLAETERQIRLGFSIPAQSYRQLIAPSKDPGQAVSGGHQLLLQNVHLAPSFAFTALDSDRPHCLRSPMAWIKCRSLIIVIQTRRLRSWFCLPLVRGYTSTRPLALHS